jgi:glycosyltransferase involved in cell wall biosynthesis
MPIVTTDVGGNAEVVIEGANGFVVPARDDRALARAMQRVLKLPDTERLRMSEFGRQLARENFEIERILDRWEALYREQMRRKSGRPIH